MQYHRPQAIIAQRQSRAVPAARCRARGCRVVHWVAVMLLALSLPALARGQNCKRLEPAGAGQDDAARINQCLATKGRARLTAGTFLLYSPVVFPGGKATDVEGLLLTGKGMDAT